VAIVERRLALGGLAARLDELFPDGACASCFMAPAIDDVLHRPDVDVLTGAEVVGVRGSLGRFEVEVAIRPRFVDGEACLGCPACVEACPVERPDPEERGYGARRAISLPYAGCLPYVPAIDPAACAGMNGGTCRACAEACPADAVRLDDVARTRTLRAGAIVVATGFLPGEPEGPAGVVSSWSLERMLHPNGPTAGVIRGADGRPPRAVLLVPGPGAAESDGELAADELMKLARSLRRHLPDAVVRLAGGLERSPRHAARVRALAAERVEAVDGEWVGDAVEAAGGRLAVRLRSGAGDRSERFDLVVVHGASQPAEGSAALAERLRIATDARGFLDDAGPSPFEPTATRAPGIFVAGGAAGPRPLRAAIRDGVAAAGRILGGLQPGAKLLVEPMAAEVDPVRCCGCGACVTSCAFDAVRRDAATGKARVEPLHCRACGGCAAACPTGAMVAPHSTRAQLAAEIHALLAPEERG
jgi:heterodisulfide reductase subunit A